MSILLLDVGNTRLKWATWGLGGLNFGGAIEHGGAPVLAVKSIGADAADAIWVANVTGDLLAEQMAYRLEDRYDVVPRFAAVVSGFAGLRVAYAEPQRLGVDRWLCLLAAWSEVRGAACVVSAGTALTFDAVDASGQHLGGVIAPGLMAAQQNVLETTRFPASRPAQLYTDGLGADTDACVRQGALHGAVGLVERLGARYGASARCLLTGGDADTLRPHLAGAWEVRPNLVMEGLLAYASVAP